MNAPAAPPPRGTPSRRFAWLLMLMIASAAIYAAVALWLDIKAADDEASHRVMETSLLASDRTDAYFRQWQAVIGALTEHDCLRLRRPADCAQLFIRLNRRFPAVVNFAAIDEAGNFFATGRAGADPERPNVSQLRPFRELADGRQRSLVDPQFSPLVNERVGGVAVPLSSPDGRFNGLLGLSLRFSELEALWRDNAPYPGVGLFVFNREGRLIHTQNGDPLPTGRNAADIGLPAALPESPGAVDFEHEGRQFNAYLSYVGEREWAIVAVQERRSPLAGYLGSKRLGLKLFLPLALLTIVGGVLALRGQRVQQRLQDSERRLHEALARTEHQVDERTRLLTENEARYRALFEQSPNGVVMTDLDGRVVEFNVNAATLLDYTPEEFAGLNVRELEDRASADDTQRRLGSIASAGGDVFETRLRTKSGHPVDMLVSVRTIELSTRKMLLAVWTDLTPVQRIREVQTRLQSIVEASRDAIILIDDRGLILYANPGTEQLLGWPAGELLGQQIAVLIPPDQRNAHQSGLARAIDQRKPVNPSPIEAEVQHKDGRRVPVELSLASWEENGHLLFSGILRDVSERRQAQDRLQFTQKMEAVGILAGGIAHDFNNLLAIILGHSQLIFDRAADNDPNRASSEKINKAVLKARALIKQLLDFSRASDEAPKTMSLADELLEVEALIRSSVPRHIELRIEAAGTLGAIRAVPHQIQQIFINLINNACDAVGSTRGTVEVKLAEEEIRDPVGTTDGHVLPGHYVVARVLDNGPGIAESIHDRIFLPFFTTKDVGRGTGLGLAVVRNIVRQSHGYIRVFNRLSGGACFELYFPMVESTPAAQVEALPEVRGGGEAVIFVDDEPDVVEAYAEYLTRVGFAPRVFNSPAEALAEIERHPDDVRVVVSDLVMPGMDGLELAHAIHKRVPALPVLLLTGRGERITHDQMKTCGIAGLISKPAEPRLIAAEVRRTLDRGARRLQ